MSASAATRDLAFVVADAAGVIVEANARALALVGTDGLAGRRLDDILPAGDADAEPGTRRVRRADGSEVPVLATAIPLGERVGYGFVELLDPESLRATFVPSNSLPSRLVDALAIGIVVQVGAEIVSANPAAAQTLGLTLDELLGRTSIDARWRAVREDNSPFAGEEHPAMVALRTGEPATAIMGVHTPAGELRWIDVVSKPLVTDAGIVVATFSQFIDITAQRRADDARNATLVRYETLLADASDAVLVVLPDATIDYASPSAGHTLGRSDGTIVGTNLLALAVTEDRPEFAHGFEQCAARPSAHVALTARIDARDGTERWFEVRLRNAVDVPEVGALVVTLTDVHERVVAVERLRSVNIELEQRLVERDEEHRVDHELSVATELLSHCEDDREVQGVLWSAATAIFRDAPITFLRARPGTSVLEVVGATGPTHRSIDADECWAMRTHRVHESRPPAGLTCEHLDDDTPPTICVPLGLATRPYGLLVVHTDGPAHLAHATALAERVGPLIARATGSVA